MTMRKPKPNETERALRALRKHPRGLDAIAKSTKLSRDEAMVAVLSLFVVPKGTPKRAKLYWGVYHTCRRRPVEVRTWARGFRPTPSPCPKCRVPCKDDDYLYEMMAARRTRG